MRELPEPDRRHVYRFPDGSRVEPGEICGLWHAYHSDGKFIGFCFQSVQDAAAALENERKPT